MLYFENTPGVFKPWTGELVRNVKHSTNVADLWSEQELAAVGLYRPVTSPVPPGYYVISREVKRMNGVVRYEDTYSSKPPMPVQGEIPKSISDRQFFQALVPAYISEAEALAAVQTGTIPAMLEGFIGSLPAEDAFSARMLLAGATVFERDHPLTETLAASQGWSKTMLDDFFRLASTL